MARLAAIERGLYYPTPLGIIDLIAAYIKLKGRDQHQGVIFDPCCGEGSAVARLAEQLNARHTGADYYHKWRKDRYYYSSDARPEGEWAAVGVELDVERAKAASVLLGAENVIQGAFEQIAKDEGAGANILFLNPPYDSEGGQRTEAKFIKLAMHYLNDNELAILILPDHMVGEGKNVAQLVNALRGKVYLHDLAVYKFPEPHYAAFKQHVVFVRKGSHTPATHNFRVVGELGEAPPTGLYSNNNSNSIDIWRGAANTGFAISKVSDELPRESVWANGGPGPDLSHLIGRPGLDVTEMQPLAPLGKPHAAMVAAGGAAGGLRIAAESGERLLVRGHVEKRVVELTETETAIDGREIKIERETQRLVAVLSTLNLDTGTTKVVDSLDSESEAAFEDLLMTNAEAFVGAAEETYPPLLTPEIVEKWRPTINKVCAPSVLKGHKNGLFEAQVVRVAAIREGWRAKQCLTLDGEMSCGKTVMSLAAAATYAENLLPKNRNIIVMLPAKDALLRKWEREAKRALRKFKGLKVFPVGIKTYPVGKGKKAKLPIREIDEAFAYEDGISLILMKSTTAKLGGGGEDAPWATRIVGMSWSRHYVDKPDEERFADDQIAERRGNITQYKNGLFLRQAKEGHWQSGVLVKEAVCPACSEPMFDENFGPEDLGKGRGRKCRACGHVLWTRVNKNGRPKFPLATYIRDRFHSRYVLIIDEAHETKSADTAISYAATNLVVSARKMLQMTGTLFGGKASSLFHILHRCSPTFRQVYAHNDVQEFVNAYGLTEKLTKWYPQKSGTSYSGYREVKGRPQEIPGVDPGMVMLLLPHTTFISLDDLDFNMPSYVEHTLFVEPGEKLKKSVLQFLAAAGSYAATEARDGNHSPMGQYRQARIGTSNIPLEADHVGTVAKELPKVPGGHIFKKEEALLRLVWDAKQRGRRVMVFTGQIEARDPTPRMLKLLKRFGMSGVVMRQKQKKRVEFLERAAKKYDVVFCSPGLVSTGIDLPMFATGVWFSPNYNMYEVAQANRRFWRLNQELDVEIYYLAYQFFPEAPAFTYIAEKMAGQQALRGDIRSGLARLLGEHTFVSRLQDSVVDIEHLESDMSIEDLPELIEGGRIEMEETLTVALLDDLAEGKRLNVSVDLGDDFRKSILHVKAQHKGLCLFEVGNFYEAFDEDAKTVARELDLVATSRDGIAICGVPAYTLDRYVGTLIEKGYTVAICEQAKAEPAELDRAQLVAEMTGVGECPREKPVAPPAYKMQNRGGGDEVATGTAGHAGWKAYIVSGKSYLVFDTKPPDITMRKLEEMGWKRSQNQDTVWAHHQEVHGFGWLKGDAAYGLVPKDTLPPLYSTEKAGDEVVAKVKLFALGSNWTWFLTEYDPETRIAFGLTQGHELELGYISIEELEELQYAPIKGMGEIPMVERDLHWTPKTLGEIRAKIDPPAEEDPATTTVAFGLTPEQLEALEKPEAAVSPREALAAVASKPEVSRRPVFGKAQSNGKRRAKKGAQAQMSLW